MAVKTRIQYITDLVEQLISKVLAEDIPKKYYRGHPRLQTLLGQRQVQCCVCRAKENPSRATTICSKCLKCLRGLLNTTVDTTYRLQCFIQNCACKEVTALQSPNLLVCTKLNAFSCAHCAQHIVLMITILHIFKFQH